MTLSQTTLLRVGAFLIDALGAALVLMIPATLVSYSVVWMGEGRSIALVWYGALAILMLMILFRDGMKGGRSPGKRMLGLKIRTRRGTPCGFGRSAARNVPMIVPGWNCVEAYLVLFRADSIRSGDRIAGTIVLEE
ncbi:MAG TPA: RDD family protein [Thermoanaerobaculia bacterium]|nr:RDD family protein [Thermoanaerobaculia bacterium]